MKLKNEIFLQWNTNLSLQKVLDLLRFGPCPNRINSTNIVAEIRFKLLNERVLSTREPCTCGYVTLLQSFHRATLSMHWYIAQNLLLTFSTSVLFRRSSKTIMLNRLLKVAIARSNFMNEVYNGGFSPEFRVSILKEIIALVWEYVYETKK